MNVNNVRTESFVHEQSRRIHKADGRPTPHEVNRVVKKQRDVNNDDSFFERTLSVLPAPRDYMAERF